VTKFLLARPDGPWDYPTLGFRAAAGAILDGSLFSPAITDPPDVFWSVYAGGSGQTGITLINYNGTTTPSAQAPENSIGVYRRGLGTYVPTAPAAVFALPEAVDALSSLQGMQLSTPGTPARVAADTMYAKRPGLDNYSSLVPVGPRSSANMVVSKAATSTDSRIRITPSCSATQVVLVYRNDNGDAPGAIADASVSAAVEVGGVTYPVYFPGGGRTVLVPPGGELRSLPVAIKHSGPADATPYWWVRTRITTAAGSSVPTNQVTNTAEGEGFTDNGGDLTTAGTHTVQYGFTYGPSLVLVKPKAAAPFQAIVAAVGDSLTHGEGDNPNDRGWVTRALKGLVPNVKVAYSGRTTTDLLSYYRTLYPRIQGATHATCLTGTNDLTSNPGSAIVQARMLELWGRLTDMGMMVRAATIPPRTTSTDAWATLANQTANASEPSRVTMNNWIRDGAPILAGVAVAAGSSAPGTLRTGAAGHPLVGYYEVADAAESARDSGKWKVSGAANYATLDGTHPSLLTTTAWAALINPAVFTA
jgi:lysophospholipase L1-like esterase